ncbi:Dyp-type peroxidase [Pseudonocardia sp.]|uniref:Dyp-type peroxidase n=1 Tax=Pseudonocardia sp. TaxID=60912 RepID=UPI00261A303C|nr:Dyp-type peroxidase [Pseudonocardia sp.]
MTEVSRRRLVIGAVTSGVALGAVTVTGCTGPAAAPTARFVPFHGATQTGISALPLPTRGLLASFSVQVRDRAALGGLLAGLTDEIRGLMAGTPPRTRDAAYPPVDSGLLGADPPPDDLSVVVSVGASLFDDRFGLATRRPTELITMPFLANDRLDPQRSHGDLLLALESGHADTLQFALRQLMRRTRGELVLQWLVEGYGRGAADAAAGTTPRNLLGFRDGTANLDARDPAVLDRHVWLPAGADEPEWAVGGSYQAVRIIRMFVEFWDRTQLVEQEALIGRHKISGAPLGMRDEFDDPRYDTDPDGTRIPLDSHIRRANPRTPETAGNLMLRRGFSYTRGFDGAGQLDQGLAFVSYQRSLRQGFLAVQGRLNGERLEEYVVAEGGGFFFALPGVPSEDRFLGDELVG